MLRRPSLPRLASFVIMSGLVAAVALEGPPARSQSPGAPATSTDTRPGSAGRPVPPATPANPESLDAARAAHVRQVLASIAGREKELAKDVFTNVTQIGEMPAERLLRVMEMGYAKSLGVGCDHCHVPGKWESDEKPAKMAARDMIRLMSTLNNDLLPKVAGLRNEKPLVNCTTCHRGAVTPALNLGGR